MNERLRGALLNRDVSVAELAKKCGVDLKTAGRWITTGRTPHAKHRTVAAQLLNLSPDYLWPAVKDKDPYLRPGALPAEILGTYPDRASVPRDMWLHLLNSARHSIDILVFSGTFLAQTNPKIVEMLLKRASAGVAIRLCFGDPSGSAVALRDEEEGLSGTLSAKIRASLSYFPKVSMAPNCDIRLHNVNLYASIFRYDDQALINPHVWGRPASANPLLHVRRVDDDDMYTKYTSSFDEIWDRSMSWHPHQAGGTA